MYKLLQKWFGFVLNGISTTIVDEQQENYLTHN